MCVSVCVRTRDNVLMWPWKRGKVIETESVCVCVLRHNTCLMAVYLCVSVPGVPCVLHVQKLQACVVVRSHCLAPAWVGLVVKSHENTQSWTLRVFRQPLITLQPFKPCQLYFFHTWFMWRTFPVNGEWNVLDGRAGINRRSFIGSLRILKRSVFSGLIRVYW